MSSKVFDVAQREQKRIYGATRESAVLPRGWLNSKVPDRVTQHGGEVLVSLCALRSLPRPRTHIKKESREVGIRIRLESRLVDTPTVASVGWQMNVNVNNSGMSVNHDGVLRSVSSDPRAHAPSDPVPISLGPSRHAIPF